MSVCDIIMTIEAIIISILLIAWMRCKTKVVKTECNAIRQRIKYSEYITNLYDDIKKYLDADIAFDDIADIHRIIKDCLNTEDEIINEVNLNVVKDVLHVCNLQKRLHISKLFSDTFSLMRESGDEDGK